tara:strand:- start:118 stop:345 length:228 start_codon:yes stop_codon:yes gene_type:complete
MNVAQRKPYTFLKINPWDLAQTLNLDYEIVNKKCEFNTLIQLNSPKTSLRKIIKMVRISQMMPYSEELVEVTQKR